jgi:hypothetical protein
MNIPDWQDGLDGVDQLPYYIEVSLPQISRIGQPVPGDSTRPRTNRSWRRFWKVSHVRHHEVKVQVNVDVA